MAWKAEEHTAECQSHNAKGYGDLYCDCKPVELTGHKVNCNVVINPGQLPCACGFSLQRGADKLMMAPGKRATRRRAYNKSVDRRYKDSQNLWDL